LLIAGIVLCAAASITIARSTLTRAGTAAAAPTALRPPEAKPAPAANLEAEQLDRRRVLYETVDALLQVAEFQRARRLLDADRERYADDSKPWRDLGQGYRLLADCLEHPDARYRGRAEVFLLASEARALDAKLRVACVEARDRD
jgi:predicted Zn-dependent protease